MVQNPPQFNDGTAGHRPMNNMEKMMQQHQQRPYRVDGKPSCLWPQGTVMDLDVIITDSSTLPTGWTLTTAPPSDDKTAIESTHTTNNKANPRLTKVSLKPNAPLASWRQENLILGGSSSTQKPSSILSAFLGSSSNQEMNHRNTTLHIPFTEALWNNQTHLYAYIRLMRRTAYNSGNNQGSGKEDVLVKRVELTRYRKRKRRRDEKSLLDSSTVSQTQSNKKSTSYNDNSILSQASNNKTHDQILLYLKPSLTLQMVDLGTSIQFPNRESIPRQFSSHMDWYNDDSSLYYPILYVNEFWITYESLKEVNGGLKEGRVDVRYEPVAMWKWQLQSGMEDTQRKQEAFAGEEDTSNDMLLNMILETNPILLAVTVIVSILHSIFDILAFKNDITFFKKKKSMEGLSLRSMVVNVFFSFVILLYLADNDTRYVFSLFIVLYIILFIVAEFRTALKKWGCSFMVLASNSVGLLIDIWKISKAITIKFEGGKIEWVEAKSYKKSKTKEYDEIATSHLLFVTMPLVAGYGMYSLFYQKHKSWYSWILNTLVGFIYMFGFVMMTPQLFINYKLVSVIQSVAHLNWRTMTYKSINTFIDDLFAFVIKMPIMHRLACLRDDIIFFIFCYQRYKYRIDYTRINEFGQCEEPTEEILEEMKNEEASAVSADAKEEILAEATAGEAGISNDNTVETVEQSSDNTVRRRRGARERK
ncbi:hypothetical protein ACHAWO_011582 [Cyclotella atomus]|uniref:Cleft lip and palate associated transmembrane protein n=1 Tax=Cyclotella atomus TaxID=382360 RepID=A0ABD3NYJ7_9STRA